MNAIGTTAYPGHIPPGLDLNNEPETGEVKTEFNPLAELQRAWIDPEKEIDKPPTILEIGGIETLSLGDISTVIGKAKSKKTFFVMAVLSAVSSGEWGELKGMGKNKTCLFFDTEQSLYHASRMVKRCYKMGAGTIESYSLRGYSPAQRLELIETAIHNTDNLAFVVIDGVRDLLTRGINDEEEATYISTKFLNWTQRRNIHIMVVLHMNKDNDNARGHVGTELQNKSESVISVSKSETDKSVSVVVPNYSKNMDFEPFAFTIDDTGVPVFTDMPEKAAIKRSADPVDIMDQTHFEVLEKIFKKCPGYKLSAFKDQIRNGFSERNIRFGENKARLYVTMYMNREWIKQEGQEYQYTRAIN